MAEEAGPLVALRPEVELLVGEAQAQGGHVGVAMRHLERGDRLDHNAAEPFTAASTIKVPILVALHAAVDRGDLRLDTEVRLQPEDQVGGSGVIQLFGPGATFTLRDLATLMITVSDNSATNMLIDLLGIDRINAVLDGLGMNQTRVSGKLMIVRSPSTGSNTVTAGELSDLLAAMARGEVVSMDACHRMIATLKRQQINDALPAMLPLALPAGAPIGAPRRWEMAHKTGAITRHEHDCGLLYIPGQTIAITVLTRGISNRDGKTLIARIGKAIYDAYATVP